LIDAMSQIAAALCFLASVLTALALCAFRKLIFPGGSWTRKIAPKRGLKFSDPIFAMREQVGLEALIRDTQIDLIRVGKL
jgi:hypothetical protein